MLVEPCEPPPGGEGLAIRRLREVRQAAHDGGDSDDEKDYRLSSEAQTSIRVQLAPTNLITIDLAHSPGWGVMNLIETILAI